MSDSPSSLVCPAGHPFDPAAGRFCVVCGLAAQCPNGHSIGSSDLQFCVQCGATLGGTPAAPAATLGSRPAWILPGAIALAVVAVVAAGAFMALRSGSEDNASSPGRIARPSATTKPQGGNSEAASLQGTPTPTSAYTPTAYAASPGASASTTAPAGVATSAAQAPTATYTSAAAPANPSATATPTRTATPLPPTSTPTPTRTPTPNPPTATPTQEPNVGLYGYLTIGGSPCGGCEVSFQKGITGYVLRAANNGYYDTKAAGFVITPGVWQITYSCGKNWIPTTPSSVTIVAGPQKQLEIKIGFCG